VARSNVDQAITQSVIRALVDILDEVSSMMPLLSCLDRSTQRSPNWRRAAANYKSIAIPWKKRYASGTAEPQAAKEEAERANRAKSDFLAT
jgi:hypothetical protein